VGSTSLSAGDLVGRDDELSAAAAMLAAGVRLLTLTGPPGVGKTRLAIAVADAAARAGRYPDGVVFVELAASSDPVGAITELARTLGVGGASGDHAGPLVGQWLSDRRMLIVLDNAEQVADLGPELALLLDGSPRTQLLVTSRERMHLGREQELSVPPLQMPADVDLHDLAGLRAVPSVAMFVAAARAVDPRFDVTDANASAVAEICVRLDGLPLALALAAARVKLFSPAQIAARLRDRKAVLEATDRDVPARHRTLHAAISWSHAVLEPAERKLFRRLAVFAGPWTLDMADEICGDDDVDVVELLSSLIDKSLVQRLALDAPDAHFSMLQSVHDYALDRLAESGDAERVAARHLAYFAARAARAESRIATAAEDVWWESFSTYDADVRTARDAALSRDDVDGALATTTALCWSWYLSGHLGAAKAAVVEVAPLAERHLADAGLVGSFRIISGIVAWSTGDLDAAQKALETARAEADARADSRRLAMAYAFLGNVARDRADYDQAAESHRRALELYDGLGQERGSAWARFDLGRVAWQRGDLDDAVRLFREALDRFRAMEYQWAVGWSGWALGTALSETGRIEDGGPLLATAMSDFDVIPDFRGLCLCWESIASLAARRASHAEAVRLIAASTALRSRLRVPRTDVEAGRVERALETAREAIGDFALDRERQRGQTLSTADARRLAVDLAAHGKPPDRRTRPGWEVLTGREREVAELVAEGCTNQQIGRRLGIAARTAEAHVHNIMAKLDARSRAEVAVWAVTSPRPTSGADAS
jgi:non-specific serine/threonine protein kinase